MLENLGAVLLFLIGAALWRSAVIDESSSNAVFDKFLAGFVLILIAIGIVVVRM